MKLKKLGTVVMGAVLFISAGQAVAGSDNEVYLAVKWQVGKFKAAVISVGYRDADVKTNGDTDGYDVSVSYNLARKGFNKIVATAFNGDENIQPGFGVGYSLLDKSVLFRAGLHAKYTNANVDYLLNNRFEFEIGVDTVDEYDRPAVGGGAVGVTDLR